MKILRAYKTQLNPNNQQITKMKMNCGAARFGFNYALNKKKEFFDKKEKIPNNMKITDQQIEDAFNGYDFGPIIGANVKEKREFLAKNVFKQVSGYYSGNSVKSIMRSLTLLPQETRNNIPDKIACKWAYLTLFSNKT